MSDSMPAPPPPSVLFETKPTLTGYKLRGVAFHSPGGGISVTLFRRTLQSPTAAKTEHWQAWFIVSELVVYAPMAFAEIMHCYTNWLNFYDANLKDELGPLADKLFALTEFAPPPNAPQGSSLN